MDTVFLGIAFVAAVVCATTLFTGLVFLGIAGSAALFNLGRHTANQQIGWKKTAKKMGHIGLMCLVWASTSAGFAIFFGAASGKL